MNDRLLQAHLLRAVKKVLRGRQPDFDAPVMKHSAWVEITPLVLTQIQRLDHIKRRAFTKVRNDDQVERVTVEGLGERWLAGWLAGKTYPVFVDEKAHPFDHTIRVRVVEVWQGQHCPECACPAKRNGGAIFGHPAYVCGHCKFIFTEQTAAGLGGEDPPGFSVDGSINLGD